MFRGKRQTTRFDVTHNILLYGAMARRLPSLNALRAFEAAARHVSFTGAAEELNVSHAAVSRHIRDLEAWLDTELFVRTGRGVTLTPAGENYGRQLTPLFDGLVDVTQQVLDWREAPRISLSVEIAFASWWLMPRLRRFTDAHPDITLDLDSNDALVNFRSDHVDIAIRYGSGRWPGLQAQELVKVQVFPVCSKEMLETQKFRSPRDLENAVLLHEESKQWWADWLNAAGADNVNPRRGPMFRGFLALEAAASGQGLALADNVVAATGLIEGWLVKPFALTVPEDAYYIVAPDGARPSEAIEVFCRWLHDEIRLSEDTLSTALATT